MKKLLCSLLLIGTALTVSAQNVGEAFYIYRNDGDFNAFFREEVDSIDYSCYDVDSILYSGAVTQVVYTRDSIYRIPLAVIDSVGFVQPETVLQPDVILMEKTGLSDYLQGADGMTLFFRPDIPNDLQPQIGNVLVFTDFDSPLFDEGFVGRVSNTEMLSDAFRVECDSIDDFLDIFQQLISVDKIKDESAATGRRKISGDWYSDTYPINFNIGFKKNFSWGDISLYGALEGNYYAVIVYNLTRSNQYLNFRLHHDWQFSAHLKGSIDLDRLTFSDIISDVKPLVTLRFPTIAPVFKFEIGGCEFIKGEGNVELDLSLSSPVHAYYSEVTYNNGHFSGSNNKLPPEEDNSPSFNASLSLNGSLHTGYMVDISLGTIKALKSYLRSSLDFYIGPKLTGDFNLQVGTENPVNFYSMFKDSKLGLSRLTVDYEFYGAASLFGHEFTRYMFCDGTIQTPYYVELYLMPDFINSKLETNNANLSANYFSRPKRNLLLPVYVGAGLYDKMGNLQELRYEEPLYWLDNLGINVNQTFTGLQYNTEYEVKPMIKFLGFDVPALPTEKFTLEKQLSVETLGAGNVNDKSAVLSGKVKGFVAGVDDGEAGFYYNTAGSLDIERQRVVAGNLSQFTDGEFTATLTNLKADQTYTYYAYYLDSDGEELLGDEQTFTTTSASEPTPGLTNCPDANHPHMIDLGLPSGTKWACCNVGASTPESYGGYFAWGETSGKSVYDWYSYQYSDSYANCEHIGDNIAGTEYDVATAAWGSSWKMPTLEQFQELFDNTTSVWFTQNGVEGRLFTGSNGGFIFLPAAGNHADADLNSDGERGYYWSSTLKTGKERYAWGINFSETKQTTYDFGRYYGLSVRPVAK